MTAYEKMMLRSEVIGSTIREQMINNTREEVEALLEDDPSYKIGVEILDKGTINARFNNYKIVGGIPQMDIQASLSDNITFTLGDVFVYDDGYWLCTDSRNFHDIYRTGKVEECNYRVKWQNSETFEIISRWCVIKDPYASGIDEGKVVSAGNAKYKVKLPYDKETVLLNKDKRFLINVSNNEPIAYKLVRFDDATNKYESRQEGFLVINLDECALDLEKDNFELMVADYQEPPIPSPTPIGLCKIVYSGEPTLKCGGSAKTFTVVFLDENDNVITTIDPIWSIEPSELVDSNKIVILSAIGNEIRLQADDGAPIGESFVLKVEAQDDFYGYFEAEIVISIEDLW